MSEVGFEAGRGSEAADRATRSRWAAFAATAAMLAIILSQLLGFRLPGNRDQRGVTTVEYIFGALIGIAVVGCIAALFASGAMDKVAEGVMKWIFGQRPGGGG